MSITRVGTFDSAHRVVSHTSGCRHIHGHTYKCELTFGFEETEKIGYAIDFKEIKRVYFQWIEDFLDHGIILNPSDQQLLSFCMGNSYKVWKMSLNGQGVFCNPTAENIAEELFYAISFMATIQYAGRLWLSSIRLWETPNCFVDFSSPRHGRQNNFLFTNGELIEKYIKEKGMQTYSANV